MNVYGIRLVFRRLVGLVLIKVTLCDHLDVSIINVDADWTAECDRHRAISREERPPYAFPESLVRSTELGALHAARRQPRLENQNIMCESDVQQYLLCMPDPCATTTATLLQ